VARLTDDVRANAAAIAASAGAVRIDTDALEGLPFADVPAPALDPAVHFLDGPPEAVAEYVLTLDAINFGSGWFPTLRKRTGADGRTVSGATTVAWALGDRFRAHGPWSAAQLRAMQTDEIADVLGQPRDHELMALYAQALRELGRFLGAQSALDVVRAASGSAERLAESVTAMAMWNDRGFYKRAQILGSDLALTGVAEFGDLDRLTLFADNLIPHVLRCEGVLVLDDALATKIDAGQLLRPGVEDVALRGCAVHAVELLSRRTGLAPRVLDAWLWTRGQSPEYKSRPRPRARCVWY
jgi:hypothetical protein